MYKAYQSKLSMTNSTRTMFHDEELTEDENDVEFVKAKNYKYSCLLNHLAELYSLYIENEVAIEALQAIELQESEKWIDDLNGLRSCESKLYYLIEGFGEVLPQQEKRIFEKTVGMSFKDFESSQW